MAAENYHLKWDSHLSYLNSSVATLYKNEKFADVVLYSSSNISGANGSPADCGIPTVGISAHKFILSSCSQFFATMFETAPICAPNSVLYVVLPPDLSHRAIQILVQYMYSGEATVANDILSEVLRGGEILKIRGLCRTTSNSATHHHHQQQRSDLGTTAVNSLPHYGANGTRPPPVALPPVQHNQLAGAHANDLYASNSSKCTSTVSGTCDGRYASEHTQQPPPAQQPPTHSHPHPHTHQHQQFRGLGASVMPKDSPVIVKSPKIQQIPLLPHSSKLHTGGGISVNKEVAIDPEEKCCYQLSQHEPLPVTSAMCSEVGCNSGCPLSSAEAEQLQRRRHSQSEDPLALSTQLDRKYAERPRAAPDEQCERDRLNMGSFERGLRRGSGGVEHMREYFASESYEHDNIGSSSKQQFIDGVASGRLPSTSPHPHNFLAIKQEPADWSGSNSAEIQHNDSTNRVTTPTLQSPKQPLDFKMPLSGAAVKLEVGSCGQNGDEEESTPEALVGHVGGEYDNYSRLVCEICKKSFDEPKAWVRHLETHAAAAPVASSSSSSGGGGGGGGTTGASGGNASAAVSANSNDAQVKTYVPKKRRRVSQQENHVDHVTLLCDLCSTSFETPAEWVRHMNNQHTEIELAMFNSKKDSEQKTNAYANTSAASSSISQSCATNTSSNNHQHTPSQQHSQKKYTNRSSGYSYSNAEQSATERICDICSKKFSTHNHMLAHKRSHNTDATTTSLLSASSVMGTVNAPSESYNATPSQA